MKQFLKGMLLRFKPLVQRMATLYDIKVYSHCSAVGTHSLTIEGLDDVRRGNIPKSVYFNTGSGDIHVGKDTIFGENVMIVTGTHYDEDEAKSNGLPHHYVPSGRGINIGSGCFIGSGAIVLGNVNIGDGCLVVAGSVVNKSVPARSVVAGNPAKIVRMF